MEYSLFQYPFSWLTASFFALPRVLSILSILPLFSRQALPGLLRIGVAFSISIFLIPGIEGELAQVQRSGTALFIVILKEVIVGFLIGFILSLPLWALEIMGVFVDNQRGAGIASSINPLTGHDSSPLGDLFSHAAVVLLIINGGFLSILGMIYESYSLWPIFNLLPEFSEKTPLILLQLLDQLMLLAILLSAPVIFAMFLAEFGLGLVSRFVPQLQVFFLAMPVKSAIAFFIFSVYAATLLQYMSTLLGDIRSPVWSALTSIFVK